MTLPVPAAERAVDRALHLACDFSAGIGGVTLIAIAGLTVVSVLGRALFSSPIQGDVELVQLGTAVCVASFLPYTQHRNANIIVDFFTTGVRERTRTMLDAFGTLLYTVMLALMCWRVGAGGLQAHENQETSPLMAIPIWIPYMLMLPGLAIAAVLGAVQTVEHFAGLRRPPDPTTAVNG